MHLRSVLAGAVAIAFCGPARADVIDTRGMQPHEQCAYCHELDGNSRMPRFPRLAGQSVTYLAKQLGDFRAGRRDNDGGAMSGIAETLSDEDAVSIARHFAAQAPRTMAGGIDGDTQAGRRLYFEGRPSVAACASCHESASPVVAGAPLITGQHAAYLEKQLLDFKRGARRNDPQGVMHRIAGALEEREIRALAAFVSGMPVMTGSFK